jgi:hypothetical protein
LEKLAENRQKFAKNLEKAWKKFAARGGRL